MTIQHSAIPDANLHQPKGAATATNGQILIASGPGSTRWETQPNGWGFYEGTDVQVIDTVATQLTLDGAGSLTEEGYLPFEILGTGSLWAGNKITPVNIGDAYDLRLALPITAKTGSPTEITVQLDIGVAATPTTVIVNTVRGASKTPPYTVVIGLPIFSLTTFKTNGGRIFVNVDTGTITSTGANIFLGRNTNGAHYL